MLKTEEFLAGVERNVKVIEAISYTLSVLELIDHAKVAFEVEGQKYRLDFMLEIERLKGALRMMGVRDDEQLPCQPPRI